MPLDTEDIKLITGLQADMEKRIVDSVNAQGSGTRAVIESEVNRIDEMDKIRNGRISHNEDEIAIVKEETKIARWAQRNKKLTIIIAAVAMMVIAFSYHTINFKRTISKYLQIELKDDHDGS